MYILAVSAAYVRTCLFRFKYINAVVRYYTGLVLFFRSFTPLSQRRIFNSRHDQNKKLEYTFSRQKCHFPVSKIKC